MPHKYEIVFIASEMVPYCKTGGLADVIGALPRELAGLGANVSVFIPYYRHVMDWAEKNDIDPEIAVERLPFFLPGYTGEAFVRKVNDPSGMTVYFVDYPTAFDRDELYTEAGSDYDDNLTRYAIFTKAALETCKHLGIRPDIVHAHDWQAAIASVYLKSHYHGDEFFQNTKSVLTIHNLGYQGRFPGEKYQGLDLPWEYFNVEGLEYFGQVNVLKGGIIYSDFITTVSPTYSKEIQTAEFGAGLDGVLQSKSEKLMGILNGVDYSEWDPSVDSFAAKKFSVKDLKGKWKCREDIRKTAGLPDGKGPLIGMISRLAEQKGFELLLDSINKLVKLDCQLVILGTGDPKYHTELTKAMEKYPENVSVMLKFSNALAHQIEAGCDIFLMPSKYEPCGLNQLYSLRYGTVPIVTATGGLKDTVNNFTAARLKKNEVTGFVMKAFSAPSLVNTVKKAVGIFRDQPDNWNKIVLAGMNKDFSWPSQAGKYLKLYKDLVEE